MKTLKLFLALSFLFCLSACYHPDINQGTPFTQEMVSSLKKGQSQSEVTTLLGTPNLKAPFDSNEWIYVYYDSPTRGKTTLKHLRLVFKGGTLSQIEVVEPK